MNLPSSELAGIDNLVFCCDVCGWYCSTEELMNEDGRNLCEDCFE